LAAVFYKYNVIFVVLVFSFSILQIYLLTCKISNYDYELITNQLGPSIYSFPLVSSLFCEDLKNDLRQFNNWTINRHDNYPTNDVLLKDFNSSLADIYDSVIRNICIPAVNKLYNIEFNTENIVHETFVGRYKPNIQAGLKLHHDSSIFTLILNLSDIMEYEGSGTYFSEDKLFIKEDKRNIVIHPGRMTHRHGVRPIISGERYAIVSFCNLK
jgi:hypothetical protein